MTALLNIDFLKNNRVHIPLFLFFVMSFFLPTASHRIIFYILIPFFLKFLYDARHDLKDLFSTVCAKFLLIYLVYFGISSFWSTNVGDASPIQSLRDVLAVLIFTTYFSVYIARFKFSSYLPIYFSSFCLIWAAIVAIIFYGFDAHPLGLRMEGFGRYENSIHFSIVLSVAVLSLMAMIVTKMLCNKIALSGLLVGLIFFIILSQTRSTFVALGICLLILPFLGYVKNSILPLVAVAAAFGISYFIWDVPFNNVVERLDSNRLEIWKDVVAGIAQNPFFGHGINTNANFYSEFAPNFEGWKSSHNTYLGHMFFGGVVGFVIYIGMMCTMAFVFLKKFLVEKRDGFLNYRTVFTCLFFVFSSVLCVFNFSHFIVNVHIQWLAFWVPFTFAWSLEYQEKKNRLGSHASTY